MRSWENRVATGDVACNPVETYEPDFSERNTVNWETPAYLRACASARACTRVGGQVQRISNRLSRVNEFLRLYRSFVWTIRRGADGRAWVHTETAINQPDVNRDTPLSACVCALERPKQIGRCYWEERDPELELRVDRRTGDSLGNSRGSKVSRARDD